MKTLYKSIFVAILGFTTLNATAQKDSTINRQVLLEREYNPTLQSASKINVEAAIYEPVIPKTNLRFINEPPKVSLHNNILGESLSGNIKTDIEYSKKRGYARFGVGTHNNIDGVAGYRLISGFHDQLDIYGNYNSTSGDLDYADGNYARTKAKAKYSDLKINLRYQHSFVPSILSIKGSFLNTGYNYYGNPYITNATLPYPSFEFGKRQNVDVFAFNAGLRSRYEEQGSLSYRVDAGYSNFKSKYGAVLDDKGSKGGILNLDLDFNTVFDANKKVGLKGGFVNQTFSKPVELYTDAFKGYTNVTATPYVGMEDAAWKAELGLNLNAIFDIKNSFTVSPNIKAHFKASDESVLYAEIGGGINDNTFLEVLQENRYASFATRVERSTTTYDAKIGFKSGIIQGVEFDIFAGHKQVNHDHLYIAQSTATFGNVSKPVYANISTGHVGGLVKTNLIPYTELSAKIVGYFYSLKYKQSYIENYTQVINPKKAWGRPSFTAELNADVKPIDHLTVSLSYLYAGGRKMYLVTETDYRNMKDINELNLRGEYQIMEWISVNLKLNNILSQNYELVPGYTLQGFNILAGVGLKF